MADLRAIREDWYFNRGDNPTFEFLFNDSDGNAIDFTGSTVVLTVNPKRDGSQTDTFQLSPAVALDSTGVVQFAPTVANMTIATGTYHYDVQWTNTSSKIRTIAYGDWVIDVEVNN